MKVLIVEDETSAYEYLAELLKTIVPDIEIAGNTESVDQTVRWLRSHDVPDLIFMDVHLSDGSSFVIFDMMDVDVPIIFTTAYDQYAIDAFKVNSIGYLLKPVKAEDLKTALKKFRKHSRQDARLLVPYRDRLVPVGMSEISFFHTSDKTTRVFLKDGNSYFYPKSLDQIFSDLDHQDFIRANKQFVISRNSVRDINICSDSRLRLTLETETPETIYVSKNRAAEFKAWMMKRQ